MPRVANIKHINLGGFCVQADMGFAVLGMVGQPLFDGLPASNGAATDGHATSWGAPVPVHEPQTDVLMLAGLLAVGWMARRWRSVCGSGAAFNLGLNGSRLPPSGNDGWVSAFNGAEPVVWSDGAIDVHDNTDGWSYLQAPDAYLAAVATGGTFSVDLRHESDGFYGRDYGVRVALSGAGTTLIAVLGLPTNNWQRDTFSLTEAAGWRVNPDTQQNYNNGAPLASLATLGAVLADLSGVYIAADYSNGNRANSHIDRSIIDNVALTGPVPEPGTWALMLGGLCALCALCALARRR